MSLRWWKINLCPVPEEVEHLLDGWGPSVFSHGLCKLTVHSYLASLFSQSRYRRDKYTWQNAGALLSTCLLVLSNRNWYVMNNCWCINDMCTYVCIGHFPWEPPLIFRLLSYIYEKPPKLISNQPVRLAVINYNSEKNTSSLWKFMM